jgi:hypothetical protein
MHSNVAVYIACSGEFFVRRLKNPNRSAEDPKQETHPNKDLPGGPPNDPPPQDPRNYELVIDNDSGTYRPDASILHLLQAFLEENLPGIHIVTKTCDDKQLEKMKKGQMERKKKEGKTLQLVQDSDGEISSSDEEELGKGPRKSKKSQMYEALEDPKALLNQLRAGGRAEKEGKEEDDDKEETQGKSGDKTEGKGGNGEKNEPETGKGNSAQAQNSGKSTTRNSEKK